MKVIDEGVYLTLGISKGSIEVIDAENESDGNIKFKTVLRHWKNNALL